VTEVRPVRDEVELEAAMALRHAVFVVEQQVPLAEELDGRDREALHLVAVADGEVVGTCRLLFRPVRATLGRMAVAPEWRGRGIGSRLLDEAEAQARASGADRIALAAQTGAVGLYERAGYRARGDRFMDAGIEHVLMEKPVA